MKKILLIIIGIIPLLANAQVPKMHIKAYAGLNVVQLVYRVENVEAAALGGLQAGVGFRVTKKNAFVELDIAYINSAITFNPEEDADYELEEPLTVRVNSIEFPISLGYIPIKTPVFKWYLYGGLVNKFSLRGRYTYDGETYKFSPKDLDIPVYNLGARFGTQVDIAMFNFDFNYTIGITNALQGRSRTNFHGFQLSVGLLF